MTNYYATVRGTIATATLQEIFQHSIAISSPTSQVDTANGVASTFLSAFGTATTKLMGVTSSQVVYTEVTCAQINHLIPTGEDDLQAATHVPFAPLLTGGRSGTMLPAQNSVCVSLTGGAKPNGAPFKGRFYLPPTDVAMVGSTGVLASTYRTQYANWAAEWLGALKFVGAIPCIWSRKSGMLSPVASIRVGDRVDTIRSRRNKGTEAYLAVNVV